MVEERREVPRPGGRQHRARPAASSSATPGWSRPTRSRSSTARSRATPRWAVRSRARGGISAGPGTNLEITRSTISKNRSRKGGGLYAVGVGSALMTNSTISGNSDTRRGRRRDLPPGGHGRHLVESTTIADNEPTAGHFPVEAGEQAAPDSLSLFASIVFNPGKECGDDEASVASDGRNVVGDKTCAFNETSSTSRPIRSWARSRTTADRRRPMRSTRRAPRSTACRAAPGSTSADCPARSGRTATRAPTSGSSEP